jgi:hypothetical protein
MIAGPDAGEETLSTRFPGKEAAAAQKVRSLQSAGMEIDR